GVGRARRNGVVVSEAPSAATEFGELLERVSIDKNFRAPISAGVLSRLLVPGKSTVTAHLFAARVDVNLAAAALILRCGNSIHYMAGATNRQFATSRAGELLQWAIVEWALDRGITRYDLEGIDAARNPGTFAFKRKMGGREVSLEGMRALPFTVIGKAAAVLLGAGAGGYR